MSVFTAGEGNDPLPAGVIAATQHSNLAQFVRCVTAASAPGAAWISGHADEWHADVWRKAGTRLRRLIGTRGLHGVLIELSELPGTQDQRAFRVVVERVFRNRASELVFSRVNVVIVCLQVRTRQECGLSGVSIGLSDSILDWHGITSPLGGIRKRFFRTPSRSCGWLSRPQTKSSQPKRPRDPACDGARRAARRS